MCISIIRPRESAETVAEDHNEPACCRLHRRQGAVKLAVLQIYNTKDKESDMRRILIGMLLLALAVGSAAAQENSLRPVLADPVDAQVQRLHVMSQRDEALDGMEYNGGYMMGRGCQPASIANAVIAAFGVEDEQAAIGVVRETTKLLVMPHQQGTGRIELSRLPLLLDIRERAAQAEKYPNLAAAIGAYGGKTAIFEAQMDAGMLQAFLEETGEQFVLASRMTVYPDWSALIEMIDLLHRAGMDDAMICLANVGVGSEKSRAPLRLGDNGHYLTVLFHVGTFMQEGRVYVLDSLPRALKGEEWGYTVTLRRPYAFMQERSKFSETFDASRIRETVIQLTLKDKAAWTEADIAQKAGILAPLILYGPGVLMISAN